MQEIKGVLFDNDGTLVDTYELILVSSRYATKQVLGKTIPDDVLMAEVGIPLAEQVKSFSDDPQDIETILQVYREYNHAKHDDYIATFDGLPEALAALKRANLSLGVVTSKLHKLASHGLDCCDLSQYFDFLVGADDCAIHKPNPEPILQGCKLLGLQPSECIYVGDSPFDIDAGNAAGATTIAVLWGMFSKEQLLTCNPDYVCETVDDLVRVIVG